MNMIVFDYKEEFKMKGYKVFNSDWTCRGYQYEIGKTYEIAESPKCCKVGFHFCEKLIDCFNYYSFDPNNKVAEIEAIGEIDFDDTNSKCCTNKIVILKELKWNEVLDMCNSGKGNSGHHNSGNYNSGYCNTNSPKVRMFNHETEFNFNDESIVRFKEILFDCPQSYEYSDFIDKSEMSEEEIIKHPECEIIGGYIKTIIVEADKQKWWDEDVSDDDKEFIKSLPYFDADIFYECVGVRV